jgi:hypothetical protein
MPQYDLDLTVPDAPTRLRARSAEDAVRQAAALGADAPLEVVETRDPAGWLDVVLGGEPLGRVRDHARMRFRRD